MGLLNSGVARARAAASDARADLADINTRIIPAQSWLKVTATLDTALRQARSSWVGRQPVAASVLRTAAAQGEALHTRAQATVDDLQARRLSAQSRLTMAERSQQAMTRLAEESDRIIGD